MIRFCCERCGHKVGTSDEQAGKRGKCPGCGGVIVVPEKAILVNFPCENCGEKISALPTRAGKKGKCPKCKFALVVPAAHDLTLLDAREEYKIANQPASRADPIEEAIEQEHESEEAESCGQRSLPWIVDIFLYPTSAPGLIHLGIFTIIPLLIAIVRTLLGSFGMAFGILGFIANVAISLYLCWYITECVRDSAKGGTRAPEAFATADLGEMWSQAQHIIGCYLILLGPIFFYYFFTGRTDIVFWILLAYGVLFFPMGLLATVMFDSTSGLNPFLLIGSIFSTFFQYCGLVLLIGGITLIFKAITTMEMGQTQRAPVAMLMLGGIFYSLSLYAVFIVAHLLGRFYWRNKEKLNWEV